MEPVKTNPAPCLLARPKRSRQLRVAVLAGKGGVGKTTLSVNLAVSIASRGRGAVLMDCDLSAGQAHVLLGISPCSGLAQVIRGEKALRQVLIQARNGLHIAPGGPPGGDALEMAGRNVQSLLAEAQTAIPSSTVVILDTGPSRIAAASGFARGVDLSLVVTTPEPTSMRATVALLERLYCDFPAVSPWVLINMSPGDGDGRATFDRIRSALLPLFQDLARYWGALPSDAAVPRSLRQAVPSVLAAPQSHFSQNLSGLADFLCRAQAQLAHPEAGSACSGLDAPAGGGVVSDGASLDPPGPEGLDDPEMADEDEEDMGEASAA